MTSNHDAIAEILAFQKPWKGRTLCVQYQGSGIATRLDCFDCQSTLPVPESENISLGSDPTKASGNRR